MKEINSGVLNTQAKFVDARKILQHRLAASAASSQPATGKHGLTQRKTNGISGEPVMASSLFVVNRTFSFQ
jgi:hypothetical protein